MSLGQIPFLSRAKTRSISPENPTGKKGGGGLAEITNPASPARDLGRGWKVAPSVVIPPGTVFEIADIEGPGLIQQMWMTPTGNWRFSILRIYWDGAENPSVECPVGDFFACGWGQYVGTYLCWGVNNSGWWGEGEIKFYMDGDDEFPTICGTGTEDYFCGSYNFENKETKQYEEFTTPYAGLCQVIRPDGLYRSQMRFGMYRWHLMDPVRFEKDLKVTIQALGWKADGRFLPLQDDISSVAYWYQTHPAKAFPALPSRDFLEIN